MIQFDFSEEEEKKRSGGDWAKNNTLLTGSDLWRLGDGDLSSDDERDLLLLLLEVEDGRDPLRLVETISTESPQRDEFDPGGKYGYGLGFVVEERRWNI